MYESKDCSKHVNKSYIALLYYKDGILHPIEEDSKETVDGENAAKEDNKETTVETPKTDNAEDADRAEEK